LKERGYRENGYKIVFVSTQEILQRAAKKGKKDASTRWIINTKSNLVNKKIIKQRMDHKIIIPDYDKERNGYWFKVSLHIKLPQISS